METNLSGILDIKQKLVLTPKLEQSIKVLQMGSLELNDYVENMLVENPVIEVEPSYEELDKSEKLKKKLEWLEEMDEQNKVYHSAFHESDNYEFPAVASQETGLRDYLSSQLGTSSIPSRERKIAQYLIHSLDDNGYMETSLDEICKKFGISMGAAERALKRVQALEPCGVGARTLKECLFLQLQNKGIRDPNVTAMIHCCLDDLAKNKLDSISKTLKLPIEEIKRLSDIIRSLNPYPGRSFGTSQNTGYVKADVVVVKFKDFYEVVLNSFSYPRIIISSFYKSLLKSTSDTEARTYIATKIEQASSLVECIEQRNSTLLKVAKVIVELQEPFFDAGPGHLVPMTLNDVALKLSLHESTISRTIHDKYLQCPWGVFSLKHFFSSGFAASSTSNMTADSVKSEIRNLIAGEDKRKPYSDQKLSDLLNEKGIPVARRTVAKYREEMSLPGASGRKVF